MSRLSLGIRSLSFGSIPRQAPQQNGGLHSQNSINIRKTARTKEKYVQVILRYSARRKLIMLILAVFAAIALCTGIFNTRREVASESTFGGFEGWLDSKITLDVPSVCAESGGYNVYASNDSAVNAVQTPSLLNHPCKNFALPPPPPSGSRRIGPRPCPVCYIPVEQAMASMPRHPSPSPVLQHLTYFQVQNPVKTESRGGSDFGGYPSLEQRNDSFNIDQSMTVNCGFIKGCRAGSGTGFDIDAADLMDMDEHHEIIVASAIFGNYDLIQQPRNVSELARKNIPFYMFVDEETEAYLKNSSLLDSSKRVGIWRIIVVHNVPYADPRRNGKVPKLLLHRLFPNVRYSIWIDGKLQLVADPYQILERFLWRENATFAISRHYKRFDVFVEAEANKAAAKYDNSSIDYQIDFYRQEGLTPYTRAKLPITSDVPEGCVIIREHIPITNLFTCLWFNEVDRFTSRDQLSFATVRDKIMAKANWTISMFLDCERRNFVVQAYHRDLLERMPPPLIAKPRSPPKPRSPAKPKIYPPPVVHAPVKKSPMKRSKGGKKSGSKAKRHRKVDAGVRDT